MNVAVVARTRWRLAVRAFAPRAQRSLFRIALSIVAVAFVPVVLWFGFTSAFELLHASGAGAAEAAIVLAFAFNAVLVVLLVSDLHATVATLLIDPDLDLLRRAPVGPRPVLILKLVDALPQSAGGLLLIAVPAVLAYHAVYSLPAWSWALVALMLAALWAIPLGLGTAAAVWVLERVPGKRVREALGALTAIMLFSVWLVSVLLSLSQQEDRALADSLRAALQRVPVLYRQGPAHWAAEALGAAAEGRAGTAVVNAGALLLAALAALALAVRVAAQRLETVQSRLHGVGPGRRAMTRASVTTPAPTPAAAADRTPAGAATRGTFPTSRLVRVLAARDARLFLRDWPVLSDVVIAAILWSFLPLLWSEMFGDRALTIARAMFLALAVGLGNEIAGRAVPIERAGLAWTRLAPLAPATWVAGKLMVAGSASAIVLAVAAAITIPALRLPWPAGLLALASTIPALALSTGLGLWIGAVFARTDWTNPRGMLTQTGRLVGAGAMLAQVVLWWGWAAALERLDFEPVVAVVWGVPIAALLLAPLVWLALARRVRAGLAQNLG